MQKFTIVRGLFDNRKRQLIIDKNFIKFENSDFKSHLFTTILKEDLVGFRYGFEMIKGLEFNIGREYKIFLKIKDNKELKINFKLFYARKLQEKHQLYNDIVNCIWNYYGVDLVENYLEKYQQNVSFSICGVEITSNQIRFGKKYIDFVDLEIKEFFHYFTIQSKKDAYNNKMLYFLKDENAVILFSVLKQIIKNE